MPEPGDRWVRCQSATLVCNSEENDCISLESVVARALATFPR
jgi:hypothetical protein